MCFLCKVAQLPFLPRTRKSQLVCPILLFCFLLLFLSRVVLFRGGLNWMVSSRSRFKPKRCGPQSSPRWQSFASQAINPQTGGCLVLFVMSQEASPEVPALWPTDLCLIRGKIFCPLPSCDLEQLQGTPCGRWGGLPENLRLNRSA